jgi:hypothetical protein
MKLVKSLLLGSAAGLMAVAGAQAADLPSRKAAPAAEYVRVCSAYGAGFFFIPGSDTCLQLSGRVRAQYAFGTQRDSQSSTVGFRALLRMGMDARTQTEYGTVRAVARITAERRTGLANTGTGERAGNTISGTNIEVGNRLQTQVNVDAAFIQFAGITAGRAPSFFNDIMAVDDYHGLHYSGLGSGATNLLAYTASFGGGFSATLSLEDSLERRYAGSNIAINAVGFAAGAVALGGVNRTSRSVDVVANLRLDQAWGSVGASAALVPHTFGTTALGNGVAPGDEYGYALAAATKINLPFLTPGSNFQLTGAYGVGANSYVFGNAFHHSSNGNGGFGAVGQRLNLSSSDVILAVGPTGIVSAELTKSWSIAGALQVFWTPRLRSTFGASYAQSDFRNGFYNPANAASAASALGRDYGVYSIMGNLIWSPVRAMDIGVELLYSQANVKGLPVQDLTAAGGLIRTTKKDDQLMARIRINRDF